MLSQIVSHGNNNDEIKYRNREKKKEETSEYGKNHSEQENRCFDGLTVVLAYKKIPGDRYSPRQWMNYLTNLTYSCNSATAPEI